MRHTIQSIQTGQIVRWRVVHESAVFAPDEEMVGEVDIGSSPVNERGPSLRSRDEATPSRLDRAMVDYARRTHGQALWVENQSARPSQSKQRAMKLARGQIAICR